MSKIASKYSDIAAAVINNGSCYDFVKTIPDNSVNLIVTSPPYNLGKEYEKRSSLNEYYNKEGELYNLVRQGRGVPAVPLVIIGIEP
jgi:DNA modification methylase